MTPPKAPTHPIQALTSPKHNPPRKLEAIYSDLTIALPMAQQNQMQGYAGPQPFVGLWDTGATSTAINKRVALQLGLQPIGQINVQTANNSAPADVYLVDLMILHANVSFPNIPVTGLDLGQVDVLIGMDIITLGDFSITNLNGGTVMTYRKPSVERHDFVPAANAHNLLFTRIQTAKSPQVHGKNTGSKKRR